MAYKYSLRDVQDHYKTLIVTTGWDGFAEQYNHAITSGRIIPNTFYMVEAKAHIERCLEYAMKYDLLPTGFEVERVEQSLGPDSGNCILDVVGKKNGKPTFIDYKVKWKCKLDYVDQELEKYRYDWKEARHYPWALSQVTGQRVEEYSVVMFILQPQFKVVQRTYQVNWPVVERWAQACGDPEWGLWEAMEGAVCPPEIPQVQSNACYSNYFPCEYLDACWTYNLDREKMGAGGLVQVFCDSPPAHLTMIQSGYSEEFQRKSIGPEKRYRFQCSHKGRPLPILNFF